jgi:hypothetical protein
MQDSICMCACEVFVSQGLEVGSGDQDRHADEVVVEKVIEGCEVEIAFLERFDGGEGGVDGGVGERDIVEGCEAEEERGGEGAFDV